MGAKASGAQAEQAQAIKGFRLQTALYGVPIPLVYGTSRIAGSIAWVENFQAHPHNAASGSKKGGRVADVQYTYTASAVIVLCEGPAYSIGTAVPGATKLAVNQQGKEVPLKSVTPGVWKLKKVLYINPLYGGPNEHHAGFWPFLGREFTVPTWPATGRASDGINWPFVQGLLPPLDLGEATGTPPPGGTTVGLYWKHMVDKFPDEAQVFPALAYVAGRNLPLDSNASLPTFNFPVIGLLPYFTTYGIVSTGHQAIYDADPAQIIFDLLTNRVHGLGQQPTLSHGWIDPSYAGSYLADYFTGANSLSAYCRASEILISPVYDAAMPAATILEDLAALCDVGLVWSGGRLKIIPYGDQAVTSTFTGVTYDPTVPSANPGGAYLGAVADLGPDDFLGVPSVMITRKRATDIPNTVQVEFLNRENAYAPEVAEAKDAAGIETGSGVIRNAPPRSMHAICTQALGRATAQRVLQREITQRATYQFTLDWRWMLLEAMDVVTLNDPGTGLVLYPVRLTSVEETANGDFVCDATDLPVGTRTALTYASQAAAGRAVDYNEPAGALREPVLWEAPFTAEDGRVVLQVAASGADNWGGAGVWLSEDGAEYVRVATITAPSIHGRLLAALPVGDATDNTNLADVLLEGAATVSGVGIVRARALQSALYVGRGNVYEIAAFANATFMGTDFGRARYRLGGPLIRGAYQTAIAAHMVNDNVAVVRTAAAVLLEPRLIGRTVYLKLQSQNVYGSGQPDLAILDPIEWKVSGVGLLYPPAAITGLREAYQDTHLALVWDPIVDPRGVQYEIRRGAIWGTATMVSRVTEPRFQLTGGGTYWIAARVVVETGRGTEVVYGPPLETTFDGAVLVANVIVSSDQAAAQWPGIADPYAYAVFSDGNGPLLYLRGGRETDPPGLDFSGHGLHATVGPGVTRVPGLFVGGGDRSDLAYGFLNDVGAVTLWIEGASGAAGQLGRLGGIAPTGWTFSCVLQRDRIGTIEVLFAAEISTPGRHPMLYIDASDQLILAGTGGGVGDSPTGLYVDTVSAIYRIAWIFDGSVLHRVTLNGSTVVVAQTAEWDPVRDLVIGANTGGLNPLLGVMDEIVFVETPWADETLAAIEAITYLDSVSYGTLTEAVAYDAERNAILLAGGPPFGPYSSVAAMASFAYGAGPAPGERVGYYYLPPFSPSAVALGQDVALRIDGSVTAEAVPVFPSFADAPSVDALEVVDGAQGTFASATLEVAFATGRGAFGEPDGARFGSWRALIPGVYRASRAKFRIRLAAERNNVTTRVTACGVTVDVPDRIQSGVASTAVGQAVRIGSSAEFPVAGDTVIEIPLDADVPASGSATEHILIAVAFGHGPGTSFGTASDDAGHTYARDVAVTPAGLNTLTPRVAIFSAKVTTALERGQVLRVSGVPVDAYKAAVAVRVTGLASSGWFAGNTSDAGGQQGGKAGTFDLAAGTLTITPPRFVLGAWGVRTQLQTPESGQGGTFLPPPGAPLLGTASTRAFPGGAYDAALAVAWAVGVATPMALAAQVQASFNPLFCGVQAAYVMAAFSGFTTIAFPTAFNAPPVVSIVVESPSGLTVPDEIEKTNITPTSFDVRIKNGGSVVARAISWTAQGY